MAMQSKEHTVLHLLNLGIPSSNSRSPISLLLSSCGCRGLETGRFLEPRSSTECSED